MRLLGDDGILTKDKRKHSLSKNNRKCQLKKSTKKQQNEHFKKAMKALNAPFKKKKREILGTYICGSHYSVFGRALCNTNKSEHAVLMTQLYLQSK